VGPERIDGWARTIDAFMQRYGIPVDVLPGVRRGGARIHVDLAGAIAASAVWIAVLATDPSPRAAGAAAAQDPLEVAVLLWSAGSPDGD
jgi:hypothetical protein